MTEKQFLKKIGLRIKQLRTENGLSQREFGYMIDVEKSNVSRLESGRFNTKIYTLFKVAEALELSLSELLEFEK
ncbi:MAG: helix-turn-helix transcriptional regulator [Chitinophagaceae bacterium]|nr:helix-turn-helix transcriptional regulator [Chitinophagaceae bacterium]